MSLFKKNKEPGVIILKDPLPLVIREGGIKPTTCEICYTVYQASKEHLRRELDISTRPPNNFVYTRCPICDSVNKTEFEEVSEG